MPVVFLYSATWQASQGPPSGPVYPGLQTQLLTLTLPVDSVVLLPGHAVHATSLVVFLYVPTGHGTQSTSMHSTALVPLEAFVALPHGMPSLQ